MAGYNFVYLFIFIVITVHKNRITYTQMYRKSLYFLVLFKREIYAFMLQYKMYEINFCNHDDYFK